MSPIVDAEFAKIQNKIMNNTIDDPRLTRLTQSIKEKQSVLQVIKNEIADDENNHFIVENVKLRKALEKCLEWFYKLPMREEWGLYAEVTDIIEIAREALGETEYPLGE